MKRKIVEINEELCDGCGECAPSCAEGAIQIINGKAKLVSDNLCDGLGACLGHCPQGAITVIEREADNFDMTAVHQHLAPKPTVQHHDMGGCPGSRMMSFAPRPQPEEPPKPHGQDFPRASKLRQWPVQLHLLNPQAPYFKDCSLLIAADCVPFAMAGFHETLLEGHSVAIACPKLDDTEGYVEKLAAIFSQNHIEKVTVAIMQVPCCRGLHMQVQQALALCGKDIPLEVKIISLQGEVME